MANGLNVGRAISLGGGDVFLTTTNIVGARIFAEVNPSGGSPAVLQMTVPKATINSLVQQGSLQINGPVHAFSRAAWPQLNSSAVFSRVP